MTYDRQSRRRIARETQNVERRLRNSPAEPRDRTSVGATGQRWLPIENVSSETFPAYGIGEITGAQDGDGILEPTLEIDKPTKSPRFWIINGPDDIAAGATGLGTRGLPAAIARDPDDANYYGANYIAAWSPAEPWKIGTQQPGNVAPLFQARYGITRFAALYSFVTETPPLDMHGGIADLSADYDQGSTGWVACAGGSADGQNDSIGTPFFGISYASGTGIFTFDTPGAWDVFVSFSALGGSYGSSPYSLEFSTRITHPGGTKTIQSHSQDSSTGPYSAGGYCAFRTAAPLGTETLKLEMQARRVGSAAFDAHTDSTVLFRLAKQEPG